ncbi:MAG: metal ABC transporter permease [Desulfurococcaceae archaeon]
MTGRGTRQLVAFAVLLIFYYLYLSTQYGNFVWPTTMVLLALGFSSVGTITMYRRLYYLVASAPHMAFFAATSGLAMAYLLVWGHELELSLAVGTLLMLAAGFAISSGSDPDAITSVVVGATTAGGVLLAFLVLTRVPVYFDVTALMLGQPLLASPSDLMIAGIVVAISVLALLLTLHEQISLGLDRTSFRVAGPNPTLYDFLAYLLIGINVVGLLKIAGYVLEHVLLLMPPAVVSLLSRSARSAIAMLYNVTIASALLGLHMGLALNLPPTGFMGLVLLTLYVVAQIMRRARAA